MFLIEIVGKVQEFVAGFAAATARKAEIQAQYPGEIVTMQYNS
jgi:hypothetical protein